MSDQTKSDELLLHYYLYILISYYFNTASHLLQCWGFTIDSFSFSRFFYKSTIWKIANNNRVEFEVILSSTNCTCCPFCNVACSELSSGKSCLFHC